MYLLGQPRSGEANLSTRAISSDIPSENNPMDGDRILIHFVAHRPFRRERHPPLPTPGVPQAKNHVWLAGLMAQSLREKGLD